MPVHCLKNLLQTNIPDLLLDFKVIWCKFRWCNIFNQYPIAACSVPFTFAVYCSSNTPTQSSSIYIWTIFTVHDFCWLHCIHAVDSYQETKLDINLLKNITWYWSYMPQFFDLSHGCNFFFVNWYLPSCM